MPAARLQPHVPLHRFQAHVQVSWYTVIGKEFFVSSVYTYYSSRQPMPKPEPGSVNTAASANAASAPAANAAASGAAAPTSSDTSQSPVILMVSGGADSVALTVLACSRPLDLRDGRGSVRINPARLAILHVNHGLRGADADEDESYVRLLAGHFHIPCYVEHVNVAQLAKKQAAAHRGASSNIEAVGRQVRYDCATKLARQLCAQTHTRYADARIVTAHTANDRAETFLINATQGSGLAGLSSIPRKRQIIVRPLLDFTHEELCDILSKQDIPWHEDETNKDTWYMRAYMRHAVLPRLQTKNINVVRNIAASCDILADEHAFLERLAHEELTRLTRVKTRYTIALCAGRLVRLDIALARRVVRLACLELFGDLRLDADHINAILSHVFKGTGSVSLSLHAEARVEYGVLFIRATHVSHTPQPAWLTVPGSVSWFDTAARPSMLTARIVTPLVDKNPAEYARSKSVESNGRVVLLDAEKVAYAQSAGHSCSSLWVDLPQTGDSMCPFGMEGRSKKLSDLMQEAHIPMHERSYMPIIKTGVRGEIVWVGGIRTDERFCVTEHSRVLLELGFQLI